MHHSALHVGMRCTDSCLRPMAGQEFDGWEETNLALFSDRIVDDIGNIVCSAGISKLNMYRLTADAAAPAATTNIGACLTRLRVVSKRLLLRLSTRLALQIYRQSIRVVPQPKSRIRNPITVQIEPRS